MMALEGVALHAKECSLLPSCLSCSPEGQQGFSSKWPREKQEAGLLVADSPEAGLAVHGSHAGRAQADLASPLRAVHQETDVHKVLVKTTGAMQPPRMNTGPACSFLPVQRFSQKPGGHPPWSTTALSPTVTAGHVCPWST